MCAYLSREESSSKRCCLFNKSWRKKKVVWIFQASENVCQNILLFTYNLVCWPVVFFTTMTVLGQFVMSPCTCRCEILMKTAHAHTNCVFFKIGSAEALPMLCVRRVRWERERRKWRHHCRAARAKIGDEFTLSLAKNYKRMGSWW